VDRLDHGLNAQLVGHVYPESHGLAVAALDDAGSLDRRLLVDVAGRDPGAFLRELDRSRLPNAAPCPRDDRHLVLQSHDFAPAWPISDAPQL
jgi:hypothetical protein